MSAYDPKRTLIQHQRLGSSRNELPDAFSSSAASHDSLLHKGAFALVEGLHRIVRWDGP
jgi:hypothetical protein